MLCTCGGLRDTKREAAGPNPQNKYRGRQPDTDKTERTMLGRAATRVATRWRWPCAQARKRNRRAARSTTRKPKNKGQAARSGAYGATECGLQPIGAEGERRGQSSGHVRVPHLLRGASKARACPRSAPERGSGRRPRPIAPAGCARGLRGRGRGHGGMACERARMRPRTPPRARAKESPLFQGAFD